MVPPNRVGGFTLDVYIRVEFHATKYIAGEMEDKLGMSFRHRDFSPRHFEHLSRAISLETPCHERVDALSDDDQDLNTK